MHEQQWMAPPGPLTVELKSIHGRETWVVTDSVGVCEMALAFEDLSHAAQHAYTAAHPHAGGPTTPERPAE